jgi:hypothetical protein
MPQSIALPIGRRYGSAVAPLGTFHPEFYLSFRNPPSGRSARQSLFHGTFDLTFSKSPGVCVANDHGMGTFHRILCPIDFSEVARRALLHALY